MVDFILDYNRTSIPSAGMGDGTLTISPVVESDSGVLICRALNSASQGYFNRSDVVLVVIHEPIVLQVPPSQRIPATGENVTLVCQASAIAGITLLYRWTKDQAPMMTEDQVNGALMLLSVQDDPSVNGLYTCSVVLTANNANAAPLVLLMGSTLLTVQGNLHKSCKQSTIFK